MRRTWRRAQAEPVEPWRASGRHHGHGAADSQGDPGGGLRCQARLNAMLAGDLSKRLAKPKRVYYWHLEYSVAALSGLIHVISSMS